MKNSTCQKIIIALCVCAAIGAAIYGSRTAESDAQAPRPGKQTAVAQKGDIIIEVSASGRIEPERSVDIKSKASGEVVEIFADVSDEVKQGQMLFKLDPADEQRSVARLTAALDMSKARLEQQRLAVSAAESKLAADTSRAEASLKSALAEQEEYASRLARARRLYEQNVMTREELDSAVTKDVQTQAAVANARAAMDDLRVQAMELDKTRQEINIAQAQVQTDTVALEDAKQRLKETEVFSPINGVVSSRDVQKGLIVSSAVSNVGGGTTAMTLIDLSHIYAIAAVDESDISGIVPGVRAIITADAYKDIKFHGKVVRVAAKGAVESNVVTFDVKVEVESSRKLLLKPEMTTNVTFQVDERKDVVTVPAAAVVRKAARPEGEPKRDEKPRMDYSRRQTYVTVVTPDGKEEERQVTIGISDGDKTEITEGLAVGETVLLQKGGTDSKWAGQGARRNGPPPRPF